MGHSEDEAVYVQTLRLLMAGGRKAQALLDLFLSDFLASGKALASMQRTPCVNERSSRITSNHGRQ